MTVPSGDARLAGMDNPRPLHPDLERRLTRILERRDRARRRIDARFAAELGELIDAGAAVAAVARAAGVSRETIYQWRRPPEAGDPYEAVVDRDEP